MRIDRATRRRIHLQNAAFVVLLLAAVGLAAWLTDTWRYTADWTAAGRNTLSAQSHDIAGLLEKPVRATAYVAPDPLTRKSIRDLFQRYRRAGASIELKFVNPETHPAVARELGIRSGGEVILRYGKRKERLQHVSEASITNALARLARKRDRWIVFMQGHGERDPHGKANFDLGSWGRRLEERGLHVETLNLAQTPHVPDNTDLLVIASPQTDYLPGEKALIREYVQGGGNLLWLTEPGDAPRLPGLADDLGVRRLPGVVVDSTAQLYGADTPDFAVISDYGDSPIVADLDTLTLFPQACALETADGNGWSHQSLLRTRARSWTETGPIRGEIAYDKGTAELPGPLTIGVAATRGGKSGAGPGQRAAVIGDGDFLSNAYIGNGANLDLGMRLANWLAGDTSRVHIAPHKPPDIAVDMSRTAQAIVAFGYLLALPLGLLGAGLWIWLRRRRL